MKAIPSIAFNDFSGTAKEVTARKSKGRQLLSSRSQHSHIVSKAQASARARFAYVSRSWRKLSNQQIKGWQRLAGDGVAFEHFLKLNLNLKLVKSPILMEAPVIKDIPLPAFDDFYLTPTLITFIGLYIPSQDYRLVVKMSHTRNGAWSQNPNYNQCVIITPNLLSNWGDGDLTAAFTETLGYTPILGKRYYLDMYYVDSTTGASGPHYRMETVCSQVGVSSGMEYHPRMQVTMDNVESDNPKDIVSAFDFEFSAGSIIVSALLDIHYGGYSSGCTFILDSVPPGFISSYSMLLARSTDGMGRISLFSCTTNLTVGQGKKGIQIACRGGNGTRQTEIFSTAVAVN